MREIPVEHLEEQFTPYPAPDSCEAVSHHEEVEHRIQEFLTAPVPPLSGDYCVFQAEVANAIFRLSKRKAPGPDEIPIVATKKLPRKAMVVISRFFNEIFLTGYFPGCWKMSRVIAIPKAGKDPRLASNQRPITLLSHIAKLFECIMLRRLYRHLYLERSSFRFAVDTQQRFSRHEFCTTWPPSTTGGAAPLESFLITRRRSTECGTPNCCTN
ncbi:RNA-directed DNA polymerase from mobile element jockey [Eumeta japonica]|uniref:RNA-directed DNA polymerase from mobile element jockey n=1 Tax=Eumeta variegata TaxID=151549 RepID=A0A4C1V130_EUMVA|nr:RNA-directed DNA polymerase from mobile element jockey [Eumeta japonica]